MEPESLVIACMKEETKRIKGKEEKIEEEKNGEKEAILMRFYTYYEGCKGVD